jgi:CubicO group peptidase (beta-lactamase class C family)
MKTLESVATHIRERAAEHCAAAGVPGYLAGVAHGGEQVVVAHGIANNATGAPMREDTGFLYGSITKVMTTTLVLQQVERGAVDLDERVVAYLPDFRLAAPAEAGEIRVRHLLTHTNGIDADLFVPEACGPDALRHFVHELGRHCGALFAPGEYMSYSNGGMIVAGRLLEAVTGATYHELLERALFGPAGMDGSRTSAEAAILRSTAAGHFPDPEHGARLTGMFKLPDTWAPAGATAVGPVADLLAFGRVHLDGGRSPAGRRVLSEESTARMRTVAFDMGTPNVSPIGLGWLLVPFGGTTALSHSGASPGGVAVLVVLPEHDLVFAAFGNDMRAMPLHDENLLWLLREHLGVEVPDLLPRTAPAADLDRYAGTYRSNQMRVDVRVVGGQLEEDSAYEPEDEAQARIFTAFAGGALAYPPRRFVPVGKDLFVPAGMPLAAFNGYSRQFLVSYHGDAGGRPTHRCAGGRMARREAA